MLSILALTLKRRLFWRLERRGGGGGHDGRPLRSRPWMRAIAAKICTMVVCDVIYKIVYLDFPKYFYFILYKLIMLIYARNQTFCSKSVNKASKVQIFGLNTLCSILSNCTWKKIPVSKSISYVFYCFVNFLCISLFFRPFVFVVFSPKFVADTFWSTINQKLINFSKWEWK